MSPTAAKLLMCVCAGGTGAAIMPASRAIRHHVSPRAHNPVQKAVAEAVPCEPTFIAGPAPGAAGLGPDGLGGGGPASPAIGPEAAMSSPIAYGGGDNFGVGGGGSVPFLGGGGGGGGGIPSGGGGGGGTIVTPPGSGTTTPPGGGTAPPPTGVSNAPEPAAWAMMITGFGLLGGAMRYSRNTGMFKRAA